MIQPCLCAIRVPSGSPASSRTPLWFLLRNEIIWRHSSWVISPAEHRREGAPAPFGAVVDILQQHPHLGRRGLVVQIRIGSISVARVCWRLEALQAAARRDKNNPPGRYFPAPACCMSSVTMQRPGVLYPSAFPSTGPRDRSQNTRSSR